MNGPSRQRPPLRRRVLQGMPRGWGSEVHPVLQRIYAARGVFEPQQVTHRLKHLLPPHALGGLKHAVELLMLAIREDWSILIAGDYDCDGATGVAVAVRGLRMLGARHVDYVVPNRFMHGYGLSPALVASLEPAPRLLMTVDNGVSSVEGVAAARERGIRVIVTDHHLPGAQLPQCDAIVNPNLVGDPFPGKMLAGVGVMFYLLLGLRAGLRKSHDFAHGEPNLSSLLDLVALGTIADLVPLDFNNRILVDAGLKRLRQGRACAGMRALVEVSRCDPSSLCSTDLAFSIGPRLNAAGRLEDMRMGVECLLTEDARKAGYLAQQLDAINRERRALQADMVAEAEIMASMVVPSDAIGVALYEPTWHAGVVGLVASKLKERLHRPVVVFAPASTKDNEHLRGSGRSITGFHLRDALAAIDTCHPGLIERFGGHAMAAGLSLKSADYPRFAEAFDRIARERMTPESLHAVVYSDGELHAGSFTLDLARQLRDGGPWGQAFPAPVFDNVFECVHWKVMGKQHLRLQLRDPRDGALLPAVMFNAHRNLPPPTQMHAAYELVINQWQGRESPRLLLRDMWSIAS